MVQCGHSMREIPKISKVPKSTIMKNWRQYQESHKDIDSFLETRSGKLVIMTDTEEKSVEQYCLWQHETDMNLDNHVVKDYSKRLCLTPFLLIRLSFMATVYFG